LKIKLLIGIYFAALCTCFAQDEMYADSVYPDTVTYIEEVVLEEQARIKPNTDAPAEKPVYTNRSFKKGYKENYTGSKFEYTEKPRTESLWDRFWAWVWRLINGYYNSNEDGSVSGFGMLFYIGAVLFVLLAAYFIARAVMKKDGVWIFGKSRKNISVYDADDENIHEMDFSTLIAQTRQAGNYRLGIRYYYLWLLKKLSYREIIIWHTDKTNSDYQYEIKDPALKREFEYLSYVYDHSWYGEFPIDEAAFSKAEKAFLKTINTL